MIIKVYEIGSDIFTRLKSRFPFPSRNPGPNTAKTRAIIVDRYFEFDYSKGLIPVGTRVPTVIAEHFRLAGFQPVLLKIHGVSVVPGVVCPKSTEYTNTLGTTEGANIDSACIDP